MDIKINPWVALVIYVVLGGLVQVIFDNSLGIEERLADLPSWNRLAHRSLYVFYGAGLWLLCRRVSP